MDVICMTNFEAIKMKNIDKLAAWLDIYGNSEESPWLKYFNDNYCNKCPSEKVYFQYLKRNIKCSWCELNDKCKFFTNLKKPLNNKQIIRIWLESECDKI